jgi:hypothetical protein
MTLLYNKEDDIDEYEDAIGKMTNTTAKYSSFLAHPEADGMTLDELHSALYGMINFYIFRRAAKRLRNAPPVSSAATLPVAPPRWTGRWLC